MSFLLYGSEIDFYFTAAKFGACEEIRSIAFVIPSSMRSNHVPDYHRLLDSPPQFICQPLQAPCH
jgi:hypothetical protein